MSDCYNNYLQTVAGNIFIEEKTKSSFEIKFYYISEFTFFQVFDKNTKNCREIFTKTPREYLDIFYENVLTKGYEPTLILLKEDYKCVFVLHKIILKDDYYIFEVSTGEFVSCDFENKIRLGSLDNVNFIIDNAKKDHSLGCIKSSMGKFTEQHFSGKIVSSIKNKISQMKDKNTVFRYMNNLLENKGNLCNLKKQDINKILKRSRLARLLNRPEVMCGCSLIVSLLSLYSTYPEYNKDFENFDVMNITLSSSIYDAFNATF